VGEEEEEEEEEILPNTNTGIYGGDEGGVGMRVSRLIEAKLYCCNTVLCLDNNTHTHTHTHTHTTAHARGVFHFDNTIKQHGS
jgi:hypothetical protein